MHAHPAVRVDGLRKRYGDRVAVDDVSFTIARGETLALLGPNGAGKSTTVEILEGHRGRTAGSVEVLGTDPRRADRRHRQRVGIVLQSAADGGSVTVVEQLRQFAAYSPHPRDVDDVLAAVGLVGQANVRLAKLSGGQRRRVDVALGIIGRPEMLFLDEPTTGFDPEARQQFWDLIRLLQAEGTSILLTTHALDEAAALAHRAAVIVGGRVLEVAAIDDLGGPSARTPRLRWRDASGTHEERTDDPVRRIRALTDAGCVDQLEVVRPTLEDVYLEMVR